MRLLVLMAILSSILFSVFVYAGPGAQPLVQYASPEQLWAHAGEEEHEESLLEEAEQEATDTMAPCMPASVFLRVTVAKTRKGYHCWSLAGGGALGS